jgi:predicted lipoprotein with Yx(FWY)xxD motif
MKKIYAQLCAAGISGLGVASATAAPAGADRTPLATPRGITLQPLGLAQGYSLNKESATVLPREQIVYADAKGLTLYTSAADPAGKSVCIDECAKTWIPLAPVAGALATSDWSIIKRADGSQQLALKGKPLYTYIKDEDPGSVGGNSPKRLGRGPNVGPRGYVLGGRPKDEPMPEGWAAAMMFPVNDATIPAGFRIKEVEDAAGLAFVNTAGQTVYAFDGDLKKADKLCGDATCDWKPVTAPLIAKPIGDFAFLLRDDGFRQWTYKGKLLFTYSKDLAAGDANGADADKNWQVAYFARYFMPPGVGIAKTLKLGKVLATADGMTLYKRNGFIFQSGSGHGLRRGDTVRPAVGRDLGTDPRCGDCQKVWHPYLAPADAQPQGNWGVYTRADGSKQWAYQGYALWTYDGDKKSGDIAGNDTFNLAMSHDRNTEVDIGTPYDWPTALYWIVAFP